MTDRAIVPSGVPKSYAGIYEQIEDEQQPEPIALEIEGCIGREVLKNGGGAKKLIKTIVPDLTYLNASLFRGNADFTYEMLQKIREVESKSIGNRLHIECAADACRRVCNMLDNGGIADICSEVNIQYRLNLCDARSDQIQSKLLEKKEERFVLLSDVRDYTQ
ncbi:hypothetical protein KFU94_53780 [Chloroflexi bacterium TSY]|nr:hypothetical protein [Chloroflexi bacterium TSY]